MIVFDLICNNGHTFEAWFRSGDDYDSQRKAHEIACPLCGDHAVKKAVSPLNIGPSSKGEILAPENEKQTMMAPANGTDLPQLPDHIRAEFTEAIGKVKDHLEKNCDYVGDQFPEEARKIHYGETEKRNIYGEASLAESVDLTEEGIDVVPLPFIGPKSSDA